MKELSPNFSCQNRCAIVKFRNFAAVKTLFSIIGPTGIGKTRLAIQAAQLLGTEILSCDSRQFYREMKIGTAVPTAAELAEAPHHFIGNLSVNDYYSLGQYETEALGVLSEIFAKHDFAVLVGGSGMYEKALTEGLNDLPEANTEIQAELAEIFQQQGIEKLQEMLQERDPDYFNIVDKENPRRLLRALDIIQQTGRTYTANISSPQSSRNFKVIRVGIDAPRETVYERINFRVEQMLRAGLLEEAKNLLPYRHLTALNTVGYSELFDHFDGNCDLKTAVEAIKRNSRRYAKRQMTWNRKLKEVHWLPFGYSDSDLISLMQELTGKIVPQP